MKATVIEITPEERAAVERELSSGFSNIVFSNADSLRAFITTPLPSHFGNPTKQAAVQDGCHQASRLVHCS